MKTSTMRRTDVEFILWVRRYWAFLCPPAQHKIQNITMAAALKRFQPKR
jgi:hypothetical protein